MISNLCPYPEYRKADIPWLDQIPVHWSEAKMKYFFRERSEKGFPDEPMLAATQTKGVVRKEQYENRTVTAQKDLHLLKLVEEGDFVISLRSFQGGIEISHCRGIISPAYTILTPSSTFNKHYLGYVFKSTLFVDSLRLYVTGIREGQNIDYQRLSRTKIPQPPREEQEAIVQFLDYYDWKIRRYIRAKQKLIKLLNEQKQAIIHQAVTRGLDSNVRLKPSGAEWLGDVPEHWKVLRLKQIIIGKLTYGANLPAEFTNPDWPRYLRITDFDANGELHENTFRSLPPEIAKDYLVKAGDILFARSGATVGKAFLVPLEGESACHAGYLIRARPNPTIINPSFLFAYTQSRAFQQWKNSTFIISTIQNIGADKYALLYIPIPPLFEQEAICKFIYESTIGILKVIQHTQNEINLFQEYHKCLVADVVSGKLDVREASSNLPAELEETEPVEESEVESALDEEPSGDEEGEADED